MLTFAIIVPNFNQSHFLPFALESLRHQSVSINLALMDGGSTDNFREAVKPYMDIITLLRSGPDGGQAAAIEEGINSVAGDIVTWLNADDYYFPGALEKVADFFETHPEVDIIYGDAIHVNPDGFFLSYFPPIQEFNARTLTRTCFICQPACFVRRSAYEKVGGVNPALHFTMDWDLWCRLADSGAKFHYLHELIAAVRYYHGTKTLSGDKRRYREIWQIERKYGKRLLPLSWPGFYLFDLIFKEKRTVSENIVFGLLKSLRRIKKTIISLINFRIRQDYVNYGFHRWEPFVVGVGTIHLPWYDKRRCDKIRLQVKPDACKYRITFNDTESSILLAKNGIIYVVPPLFIKPCIKMSIECLAQRRWTLSDFSCELSS